MFYNCFCLLKIGDLDLSKCKSMSETFYDCYALIEIGKLNTLNVTNMNSLFYNCISLRKIGGIDFTSNTSTYRVFGNCYSLEDIGEIFNIKISGMDFSSCPLNHDTLIRMRNACHDYSADIENVHNIIIGPENIAKLTEEELAEWLQLGWTVT